MIMDTSLSAAEERGLHGLSLDSRVRRAFFAIPPQTIAELVEHMTTAAIQRKMVYMRSGRADPIRVLLRPTGVMPDQLGYLHFVSLTLINALKRLPDLYIRTLTCAPSPYYPVEEKWLWDTWGPSHRDLNPVLAPGCGARLTSPMWKVAAFPRAQPVRHRRPVLRPTRTNAGGVCLADPHATRASLAHEVGQDLRELFLEELFDHLDAISRAGRNICFIEPKYAGDGPAEQEALVEYFRDQHGLTILHADPPSCTSRR
jgi:hypothetical protein